MKPLRSCSGNQSKPKKSIVTLRIEILKAKQQIVNAIQGAHIHYLALKTIQSSENGKRRSQVVPEALQMVVVAGIPTIISEGSCCYANSETEESSTPARVKSPCRLVKSSQNALRDTYLYTTSLAPCSSLNHHQSCVPVSRSRLADPCGSSKGGRRIKTVANRIKSISFHFVRTLSRGK